MGIMKVISKKLVRKVLELMKKLAKEGDGDDDEEKEEDDEKAGDSEKEEKRQEGRRVHLVEVLERIQQEFEDGMLRGRFQQVQVVEVVALHHYQVGRQGDQFGQVPRQDAGESGEHLLHVWRVSRGDAQGPGAPDVQEERH